MPRSTRIVGGLLAAALLAAGCGSSDSGDNSAGRPATEDVELPECPVGALDSAAGPVDVTVWYQLSGKAGDTFEAQVAAYNASQDQVRVTAELQGVSYDELLRKYEQGIPSRNLPDMLVAEDTATRFLIDSDTVFPAQSCFDADGLSTDGFAEAAVNHYTVGGAMWPGSASLSNLLTYYNKNHFRRADLDPETVPATLAEVREVAETIKAAGITETPVVLKMDAWFVETQLTGDQQTMVDNDNGYGPDETTEATFDTEVTQEIFDWIKSMIDDGLMTPVQATDGNFDHYLAMANQNASITIETSTAATSVVAFLGGDTSVAAELGRGAADADAEALDIGAGQVFGLTEPGQAQIGGNGFWMMSTSTDEQISASWDFMKWWNEVDQQVTWNIEGSYLPFLDAAAEDPRVQAFWSDELAGKWLSIAYEQLQDGDPDFTGALIGPYDKFRIAMRDAMAAVAFQGADPATAITQAAEQTTQALQDYNASL
ncbi:extracellular solute-binding protein [Rhabdothermincola salaria]|uniref:extracellular solute-binding protein n=1 Tax=Rhabdothermincola salaria TaxID=2903142 RepID=UPI001E3241D2|nr:extracellular solute-binding protein [Rhabdothermincola salaria]MCD9623618.1 extracellular solute-binding protein [Rhabdothermincola salaria]